MDVALGVLQVELTEWIARVRDGEEAVVTNGGIPVARLVAVDTAPSLDGLVRQGVLGPALGPRPSADEARRVKAGGPVSELISDERR